MNLHDCRLYYCPISPNILNLTSRIDLLYALDLYKKANEVLEFRKPETDLSAYWNGTWKRTPGFSGYRGLYSQYVDGIPRTPYEKRKHRDVLRELERYGITATDANGRIDTPIEFSDRISIPTEFDYRLLNLVSIKAYIALHAGVKGHRSPNFFRFRCTQEELAQAANVSVRKLRAAIAQLVAHRLVQVEKSRKPGAEGTLFTLLDPRGTGLTLHSIGKFYQERLDEIPVYERYALCLKLHGYDIGEVTSKSPARGGSASNVAVMCPFCYQNKALRFNATVTEDSFNCFNPKCREKGNSVTLWNLLVPYRGDRLDAQAVLAGLKSVVQGTPNQIPQYATPATTNEITGMEEHCQR